MEKGNDELIAAALSQLGEMPEEEALEYIAGNLQAIDAESE